VLTSSLDLLSPAPQGVERGKGTPVSIRLQKAARQEQSLRLIKWPYFQVVNKLSTHSFDLSAAAK
jgi:hypothetical protein